MVNVLPPQLWARWSELQALKAKALDNRDQVALTKVDAQILQFAQQNSIDLSQDVMLDPNTPVPVTVHATLTGVDNNKIYKVANLVSPKLEPGSDINNALDSKKSTIAKVSDEITADLGGVGDIETVALKLVGGPFSFKFQTSIDGIVFTEVPMGSATDSVVSNAFDYFIFPKIVQGRYLKIVHPGAFPIASLEILEGLPIDATPCPPGQHMENGKCVPDVITPGAYPIPAGFTQKGVASTAFKFWGRTTTNYSSGGSGPSLRWDCVDIQDTQVLAGYEFNLGTKHGKRGDDNIDLKCRGDSHSNGKGGWYLPWISWHVDGSAGESGCGKEYPHPSTTHDSWNVDKNANANVGNIKDGKWHGFLVTVFNDHNGVPTMMGWFNPTASGKIEDYVYLGKSKDTGNMKPGPVLTKIAQLGGGQQSLQIRADEVPDVQVRNTFAVALNVTPE